MFANNSADNLLFDKSNINLFDDNINSNLNEDTPSNISYNDTNANLTSLNNVTVLPEPVSVVLRGVIYNLVNPQLPITLYYVF